MTTTRNRSRRAASSVAEMRPSRRRAATWTALELRSTGARRQGFGRGAALLLLALALTACGKKDELRPAVGEALPPKPETAPIQPTVAQLLTPSTQARPSRNDELVTRSAPLQPDRFDLPPPG